MKYVVLMLALALTLCAGACKAEDGKTENASADAAAAVESASGDTAVTQGSDSEKGLKHVDLGEESDDRVGVMSPDQSYDEDTGLPDVVESDDDMELQ